jgi:D-sedoheptulose 7-phosphate isomerase
VNREATDQIRARFEQSASAIVQASDVLADPIAQAVDIIVSALQGSGSVYLFGNGGSAADAQHISGELVGRFLADRPAYRAEALTTDASVLTALANDFGFERVFAHQLAGKGRPGDVSWGISTSGNSPNVVAGLEQAKAAGLATIAMTGRDGGGCTKFADVLLAAPADETPRIQEVHAVIGHVVCELVEAAMINQT